MKSFSFEKFPPFAIAVTSLTFFIIIILQFTKFNDDQVEKDIKRKLLENLILRKSQLEKSLYSRIYYTKGVAAYISLNPNITNESFDNLANELIKNDSVISTMSISKDCIINAIYPLKGHESALGLNLREHPMRKIIVDSTIKTRNTFVAGPVELVEGGIAFISYTPIFTKVGTGYSKFWGMADIVIWKEKLFSEIKMLPEDQRYKYALKGIDGSGENGECFWGDSTIFANDPVTVDVLLPTGHWTLASVPSSGWESYFNKTELITILLYISSLIISVLIWLLAKAIFKIRKHEKELRALFGSMEDLIIEFDGHGKYLHIAPTNETLLYKPSNELLGKKLTEIFPKQQADYFLNGISECIKSKKLITLDYPLTINSMIYWFHARISYISDNSVIFVAHDNTKQKEAQESLIQQASELKRLNATKDKLFSIIAHDLRSPFQPILSFSELLSQNSETLSKEEIKGFAVDINSVARNVFLLIENLLNWSRSQSGTIQFTPSIISLTKIIEKVIKSLQANSIQKNITIKNNVSDNINIFADEFMLHSVIQNILSNAIKFTNPGGEVIIEAVTKDFYIEISIKDNGVGISPEQLSKMFQIEHNISTSGTNNEKGNGLGLILCKEFVEKHGGKISIESVIGEGTDFTFTIQMSQV